MNDFDFLREHGFGVVYGYENTKALIDKLGTKVPKKGNKMNTQVQETPKLSPEQLALMAKQLEENGEVLVQSEADVGTEKPGAQTVH